MHSLAQDVLEVDPDNGEAAAYLRSAEKRLGAIFEAADISRASQFRPGKYNGLKVTTHSVPLGLERRLGPRRTDQKRSFIGQSVGRI